VIKAGLLLDTNNGFYKYDHLHIHSETIKNLSDEEFYSEVEQLSINVETYKQKVIQDAVDAEQKRVADEMAAELELEKQRADEAAKKEQKRLAKMPDKKRLLECANEIVFNMPMPPRDEMKTDDGISMWDLWKSRVAEFQAEIIAEINNKL